jgi:predicted alpha/beta superfamily hydrolase
MLAAPRVLATALAVAASFFIGLATTQAQPPLNPIQAAPPAFIGVSVPNAVQWDVVSKITRRGYRISVFRPLVPPPPEGYPVVYVTDADGFFATAADQMRTREFADLKPAIIVGIGYPTNDLWQTLRLRVRDLTPAPPRPDYMDAYKELFGWQGLTPADAGGGELFYRFLIDELRPDIAARYPTNPKDQTLFGHSLGGLFTLDVLLTHPESFSTYVASSPSIMWNNRALLEKIPAFKSIIERGEIQPRLLITAGGQEKPSAVVERSWSDRQKQRALREGDMVTNAVSLGAILAGIHGGRDYNVVPHVFPDENHMSVPPSSLSRGLTFALSRRLPAS